MLYFYRFDKLNYVIYFGLQLQMIMVLLLNDEFSLVNDEYVWVVQFIYFELVYMIFVGKINYGKWKGFIDLVLLNVLFKNNVLCCILL